MVISLPSGSAIIKKRHDGDDITSVLIVMFSFFNNSSAASKSSTSKAAPTPLIVPIGITLETAIAQLPTSNSSHRFFAVF